MPSPLQLIQTLLSGLGNNRPRRSGPIAMRPRMISPTASRLLSDRRMAPIESGDEYDPDSVSLNLRETQPEPWNQTRVRQLAPPDRLTKLEDEADYLAGGEDRGRGGSTIDKPGRLKSGLLMALANIGEAARNNVAAGLTDWSDLAGVAGAGAGGLGVGVASPNLIVKARHNKAVAENQRDLDSALNRANAHSIIDSRRANDQYKQSLEEKAIRDNASREKDIDRKQRYQDASLDIRQKALDGRMSFQEWQKQQKELDRQFNGEKFNETVRHNKVGENISQQNADSSRINALKPPAGAINADDATNRIAEIDAEIAEYNQQDQNEPTFEPVIDKETGLAAVNAKGQIIYSNTQTDAYRDRQLRKRQLLAEKDRLKRPQKSRAATNQTTFSISAWKKANPSGDASQAEAKARSLGYTVIN